MFGQRRLRRRSGKKFAEYLEPVESWKELRELLIAWANRGSHGGEVAAQEVRRLIKACEAAISSFNCPDCETAVWHADEGRRERLRCDCGNVRWSYG